jgi:hypothetical protein
MMMMTNSKKMFLYLSLLLGLSSQTDALLSSTKISLSSYFTPSLRCANNGPLKIAIATQKEESSRRLLATSSRTALFAEKEKRAKGVYVRPSGAIERGSGFFVPGLEGPKVRLVIGLILLIATGVNHLLLGISSSSDGGLSFSEVVAILYSVLLLFQFAIESTKESLVASTTETATKSAATEFSRASDTEVLKQKWSTKENDETYRSKVQWAAASYLSMTPTTQIMLLTDDETNGPQILYRLGGSTNGDNDVTIQGGVQAALDEVNKSKGGRIALPMSHPAVQSLLQQAESEEDRLRTVILQKITEKSCWMASSDQLLAGYTSGDLKWLGQLGAYVTTAEN